MANLSDLLAWGLLIMGIWVFLVSFKFDGSIILKIIGVVASVILIIVEGSYLYNKLNLNRR